MGWGGERIILSHLYMERYILKKLQSLFSQLSDDEAELTIGACG